METRGYSTATVARRFDMARASINTALYRHGHLYGIKPVKLPSGRLLWPADAVERLLAGEVAK